MSLDDIRQCIDENYDALHLLNSLPSHESLKWIPFSGGAAPMALIIGTSKGRDILAYVTRLGDKPIEARYCSKPSGVLGTYTWKPLSQDDVMSTKLIVPFRYNAEPSKASKRKFSIVIKWYFMTKGLVTDRVSGDLVDYCKRFSQALHKIDDGQQNESAKRSRPGTRAGDTRDETPITIEESPEPTEPRSAYGLRSAQHAKDVGIRNEAIPAPQPQLQTPVASVKAEIMDFQSLCDDLAKHGSSHLLNNIHEVDELQFFDQAILPEAQPKKLFLGRPKITHGEIHAYMISINGTHTIELWIEDPDNEDYKAPLRTEAVAMETINHPFNKAFPQSSRSLTQSDKERLEVLITWYFIASGIASIPRKEMGDYPERLRTTLEYVAGRMGPAAVAPPMLDAPETSSQTPNPRPLDESHIQSSLADVVLSPVAPPGLLSPNFSSKSSPRGTKRTAEDAVFEDIHRNVEQDMALTKEINGIDQELEMLELRKQNFMEQWEIRKQEFVEQWEKEHDVIIEKRNSISTKRNDVRKKFKRLSYHVARDIGAQ
jgi:hypothetical protein